MLRNPNSPAIVAREQVTMLQLIARTTSNLGVILLRSRGIVQNP